MKGQQILVEMKILFFILVCLLRFVLEMIRRYHTAEKKISHFKSLFIYLAVNAILHCDINP